MGLGDALGKAAGGLAGLAENLITAASKDEVVFNQFLSLLSKKGYTVIGSGGNQNSHYADFGPSKPDAEWEKLTLFLSCPAPSKARTGGLSITMPVLGPVRLDVKLVLQLKGKGGFLGLFKPKKQTSFVIIADDYVDQKLKITDQKGLESILADNLSRLEL